MSCIRRTTAAVIIGAFAIPAQAQIPVTDIGAIVQLVSQLQALEQQIATARQQLDQARTEFQAITGGRGMERLLQGSRRNYLPATWPEVQATLGTAVSDAVRRNAVLSAAQLAALSAADQLALTSERQAVAMRQLLAQQALATTSDRFAALQGLIDAIAGASDQKAILDLQARIGSEVSMLQNEQSKLQLLDRAAQADAASSQLRAREQATVDQGHFATRFQPTL